MDDDKKSTSSSDEEKIHIERRGSISSEKDDVPDIPTAESSAAVLAYLKDKKEKEERSDKDDASSDEEPQDKIGEKKAVVSAAAVAALVRNRRSQKSEQDEEKEIESSSDSETEETEEIGRIPRAVFVPVLHRDDAIEMEERKSRSASSSDVESDTEQEVIPKKLESSDRTEAPETPVSFIQEKHDEKTNDMLVTPPPDYDTVIQKEAAADAESGSIKPIIKDDNEDRAVWSNQIEFLLSCLTMSVGMGNVWRFPYMAYDNGGGAFLIPYLIVLMIISRPVYYLEMNLGQFSGFANVKMWRQCPLMKGVGYGQFVLVFTIAVYYAFVMSLSAFYFFHSFKKNLPWEDCDESLGYDIDTCLGVHDTIVYNCSEETEESIVDYYKVIEPRREICNNTVNVSALRTSTELWFEKYVTKAHSTDVGLSEGLGKPDWLLVCCLLFTWTINTIILIKGIKSSGKAAYFNAAFPYIVLIILLGKAASLDGAKDGVLLFFTPDWNALIDPNVWFSAAGQSFFSLTAGLGGIVMYSSFNPFRHNTYRDTLVVTIADTFTSILAGTITFCVLGHLAVEMNRPIEEVVDSGIALVFITWPNVISRFDKVPQLFAVLFFLMLFALGSGSSVADTSTVITIICDNFPKFRRPIVTVCICVLMFCVGLIFTTQGGIYVFELVNFYAGGFTLYFMVMFEVTAISYLYGLNRFLTDLKFMLNRSHGIYWKACLGFIIPVFLFVIIVFTFVDWKNPSYNEYQFSRTANICGAMIIVLSVGAVICWGIKEIVRHKGNILQKMKKAIRPNPKFGPKDKSLTHEWKAFHAKRDKRGLWG